MKYRFIEEYRETYKIKSMCEVLKERDDNAMSPAWRAVLPRRVHLLVRPQVR